MKYQYPKIDIPLSKKRTGKICFIADELTGTNADLDDDIHEGFTIGKGKTIYWYMIWHSSGNVTVYNKHSDSIYLKRRWISGDTEITVHFK